MDLGLSGKVVLITGGSRGIGLACAAAFLGEGARVAIASRSPENLAQAAGQLRRQGWNVHVVTANLSDAEAAVNMAGDVATALGPIDILVNSAGAAMRSPAEELTPQAWQAGMNAKYYPYIFATQAVAPAMVERGKGTVINIIGLGGKVADPTHLTGGAANAALMLATVGLATAYGHRGVRVNGINPYLTLTDRVRAAAAVRAKLQGRTEDEVMAEEQARIPLHRYGTPEDVANVALFLASDKSYYINGAIIPMDGGLHSVL